MAFLDDLDAATRSGAENAANISGGLGDANNEVNSLISGAGDLTDILEKGLSATIMLGDAIVNLAKEIGVAKAATATLAYLFMDVDDAVRDIVSDFGQTDAYTDSFMSTLVEANKELFDLDISLEEIAGIMKSFTNEMGRMVQLTTEEVNRMGVLSEATGLSSEEVGSMVAKMSDLGMGTLTAISNIEKMAVEAQKLGLNVNTFIKNIGDNIKLVNQYGFDKGINGLAKMVAKAQLLRFDIQQAVNIADGILDGGPEKAVELAAELAVLGGDIGELGDPFAMMYNSINDVGSIQDSLIDLASAAATVNEETGQIEIPAQARLRLREQAKALGVPFEELADAAINSKRQMMALEDLRISGVGNLSEEDQQFIASMSEINERGEMVVKLKREGKVQEIKLTDASGLEGAMEDLRKQQETEAQDPQDVLRENTLAMVSLKESIDKLSSKEALIRVAGASFDTGPVTKMLDDFRATVVDVKGTLSETSEDLATVFKNAVDGKLTDEDVKDVVDKTKERVLEDIDEFTKRLEISDALQTFKDSITEAADEIKKIFVGKPSTQYEGTPGTKYEEADDFILRPGQSPMKFNEDDIVIGGTDLFNEKQSTSQSQNYEPINFTEQFINQDQAYEPINMIPSIVEKQTSIIESIQNNLTSTIQKVEQTMSVKDINVNVNGSISVTDRNGNMVDLLRNPDVKNQIVMIVEDAFEKGRDQFV